MAHWKRILPGRILTLRLQDWVEDFDTTLGRVLDHLAVPHDPNCARFHESQSRVRAVRRSQVREQIQARGLGRWRAYGADLGPLINDLSRAGALATWDSTAV